MTESTTSSDRLAQRVAAFGFILQVVFCASLWGLAYWSKSDAVAVVARLMVVGLPIWLILFLIFSGYLLARSLADRTDEQAARYAAVFAIIGFLDIPIIHMSVSWWRTLHPAPIVARLGPPALPAGMLLVLMIGIVAIGLLALWLIVLRAETETLAQRAENLRALVDRHEGA